MVSIKWDREDFEKDLVCFVETLILRIRTQYNGNFIVYRILNCSFQHRSYDYLLLLVDFMFLINKICALKLKYTQTHHWLRHESRIHSSKPVLLPLLWQKRAMKANVLTHFTETIDSSSLMTLPSISPSKKLACVWMICILQTIY